MKNEELLELITELKVDDAFVEEALAEPDSGEPVKAYAGRAKRFPMRMIVPIAACLAVAAGVWIVAANQSKPPIKINNGLGSSTSTAQSSTAESTDNSGVESTDNSSAVYTPPTDIWTFPSDKKDFVEKCKNIITSTFSQVLPSDVTWQVENMDIDYDNSNELLLCPQINGRSVKGVGVCVFRRSPEDDATYLGSFGSEFSSMNLDNFYIIDNKKTKDFYYFNNNEENEKCVDSIQRLYFDNDTNTLQDQAYLRFIKTYPNDASSNTPYTETAYHYGVEISVEEFINKWRNVWWNSEFMVTTQIHGNEAHGEKSDCVQLLVDKYNVPTIGSSPNSLHRSIQSFDINNDGKTETVIEFKNCEQLRGIYVFSDDGKLIGEFDLEGTRGTWQTTAGNASTITVCLNTTLRRFYEGSDIVCLYRSSTVNGSAIYKIVVNEDGTLSSEKEFEHWYNNKTCYRINGKDVTQKEYEKAVKKYYFLNSTSIIW